MNLPICWNSGPDGFPPGRSAGTYLFNLALPGLGEEPRLVVHHRKSLGNWLITAGGDLVRAPRSGKTTLHLFSSVRMKAGSQPPDEKAQQKRPRRQQGYPEATLRTVLFFRKPTAIRLGAVPEAPPLCKRPYDSRGAGTPERLGVSSPRRWGGCYRVQRPR